MPPFFLAGAIQILLSRDQTVEAQEDSDLLPQLVQASVDCDGQSSPFPILASSVF
jgi:hypothetical protein